MSEIRLIVGLGNPGQDYEYTRHNLGFLVVNHFAKNNNLRVASSAICKAFEAKGTVSGKEVCLLFPLTYMNNSGVAIRQIVAKYEIALENILVVCDDFHIDFGKMRLRRKGSDGGHNGLDSVIYHLESEEFARLRLGIGFPPGKKDPADFVLENFDKKEKEELPFMIHDASECCAAWLTQDIGEVMNKFNQKA